MRTQVAIIGGGPAGLLVSQLLNKAGIATVIIELRSRDYVLSRIRAGVIEWGAVELIRAAGAGERMDREGIPHDGCRISDNGRLFRIDFREAAGKRVMVYGQTEITKDLYDAQDAINKLSSTMVHSAEDAGYPARFALAKGGASIDGNRADKLRQLSRGRTAL